MSGNFSFVLTEATTDGAIEPALVDAAWLQEHLHDPDLLVFDAAIGADREEPRRIPGARRFDLDGEMSAPGSHSPHTLPSAAQFTTACQRLGINDTSRVVIYDPQGIYSSARARWMLVAAGHQRVSVLDGGLPAWLALGATVELWSDGVAPDPGTFLARDWSRLVVDADAVARILADGSATVLDARSRGRFHGIEPEPRPGLRSGHMPGAVNLPYTEVLSSGRMKPVSQLRGLIDAAAGTIAPLVVSCGSGITACVVGLAAELAGREAQLYDGSWSEWGLPGDRPVVSDGTQKTASQN